MCQGDAEYGRNNVREKSFNLRLITKLHIEFYHAELILLERNRV